MTTTRTESAGGPRAHEHEISAVDDALGIQDDALADLNANHLAGTVDPSAAAGVAATIGALYGRDNAGAGELWLKTGAGATAWTRVVVP